MQILFILSAKIQSDGAQIFQSKPRGLWWSQYHKTQRDQQARMQQRKAATPSAIFPCT